MAQRVTVTLEDDLGGGPADETVRFAFGGADYEIDLSTKNATASFRKKLAPSLEHARKAGRGQTARQAAPPRTGSAAVISGLGQSPGIAVSGRGRIPASVVQQYQAATTRP